MGSSYLPDRESPSAATTETPAAGAPPLTGRLRDRYRMHGLLRSAGAAQIWLAVDEKLNRMVAVYLLPSANADSRGLLAAARAAATVPDTRFLQVLDAVDDGTNAYVVTEWLGDAADLARTLSSGPLPSWDAARITSDVVEAMASAHALGHSHLRLDPATVLRTSTEQVKIQGLRLEAALAGTRASGQPDAEGIDTRAAGALFYAALTAHWPFGPAYGLPPAPLEGGLPRPPGHLVEGIPEPVSTLALRMMAPGGGAGEPIVNCAQAAAELSRVPRQAPPRRPDPLTPQRTSRSGGQPIRGATPPPGRGRLLAVVGALLVLAGVGLLVSRLAGIGASPPQTAASTPPNSSSASSRTPVPLEAVGASLWQSSDRDEHGADVAKTLTGADGGWPTSSYANGPALATKPGTGIIYDLGSVQSLSSATVEIGAAGATLEMRAADPGMAQPPAVIPNQAPPGFRTVATQDAPSTTVTLAVAQPVRTRFVLVWFTALPRQPVVKDIHPFPYYDSIVRVRFYG